MIRAVLPAILLGLAGVVRAADALPSEADLARSAADRHPRVLQARAEAERLRVEQRADLRFPDPELRGEYGKRESYPQTDPLGETDPNRETWRAGMRVNLPNPWSWRAQTVAARMRRLAAEAAIEVEIRAAGQPVRARALDAAWLARRLLNAREQAQAEEAACAAVQERVEAGRGTADEPVRARVELLASRGALQALEQDFQAAVCDLRAATGLDVAAEPVLWAERAGPPPAVSGETLEAAQDRALDARPERRLREAQRRVTAADGCVTRRSAWPWPAYVEGGWRHDEEWESREGWSVELAVNLPVFSAMTPGARRLRAVEQDAARRALAETERAILDEVRAAWEAERAARAAWLAFESERDALRGDLERLRSADDGLGPDPAAFARVEREWRALEDRGLRLQAAAAAARLRLDEATGGR